MSKKTALCLLLLISMPFLFWQLGERGLNEPDEGRYAGISCEMFQTGEWLVPRMFDRAHVDKPPVVYWAVALSYRIFGVNEWSARLPTALAALGVLMLVGALAAEFFGPAAGLLAGLALLAMPLFFIMAHVCDPNMLLALTITLAFWSAVRWFLHGQRPALWLFYAALGLSFLTKGPVGPLVVLLALGAYRLWPSEQRLWRPLFSFPGTLLALTIGLPWFLIVTRQYPELWDFFLKRELFQRIATNVHGRYKPFYYFWILTPLVILPWLPALGLALRRARQDARTPAVRLLIAWVVVPLIVFSLSKSKLPAYILPILPAFALWIAHALTSESTTPFMRRVQAVFLLAITLVVPLGAYLAGRINHWGLAWQARDVVWLVFPMIGITLTVFSRHWKKVAGGTVALLGIYVFCLEWIARHENEISRYSSIRPLAAEVNRLRQPGDRIATWHKTPQGLRFYLRQPFHTWRHEYDLQLTSDTARIQPWTYEHDEDMVRWLTGSNRVFLVVERKKIKELPASFPPLKQIFAGGFFDLLSNR